MQFLSRAIVLCLAISPIHVQASSDVEQHLNDQYKGKTVVLRGFLHGDHLHYNLAGMPAGSAHPGVWTIDGFAKVIGFHLRGQRLTIHAERFILGNTGQTFQFQRYFDKNKSEKGRELSIEVEFNADEITAAKAEAALSRIFLTAQDRLPELVPDYWKPCVLAASTGKPPEPEETVDSSQRSGSLPKGRKQYDACSFPPEFAAIPGVVYPGEIQKANEAGTVGVKAEESTIFRVGKGVSPPRVISQNPAEFSDQARRAKYQGTAVLLIVVNKTGEVGNIRVAKPLGFGLDESAVWTLPAIFVSASSSRGDSWSMKYRLTEAT